MGMNRSGIPKTAVEDTRPTNGNSPVAPAGTSGFEGPFPKEGSSLSSKDLYMATMASLKSVLESPMLAVLANTKDESQLPDLIRQYTKLGVEVILEVIEEKGK